jgi:Methyltransferase FkbM domain
MRQSPIDSSDQRFPCVAAEVNLLDDEIFGNPDIQRLDFVKLDIEGHEDGFLAGTAETIRRFRPLLLMEVNEPIYRRRGFDPDEVIGAWMQKFEYKAAFLKRGGWQFSELSSRRSGIDDVFL